MLKSFKTEINPTEEQKARIRRTIGTCRYVYNFYLGHNKALHDNGEKFMTGKSFSLWLNNEYIPDNPDKTWIREVYSKAVKKSIEDGCTAFTRFFKHQSDFPKFKKKGKSDVKMYFVRNNPKDCQCERHRLKIPTLGWVRIKEKAKPLTISKTRTRRTEKCLCPLSAAPMKRQILNLNIPCPKHSKRGTI